MQARSAEICRYTTNGLSALTARARRMRNAGESGTCARARASHPPPRVRERRACARARVPHEIGLVGGHQADSTLRRYRDRCPLPRLVHANERPNIAPESDVGRPQTSAARMRAMRAASCGPWEADEAKVFEDPEPYPPCQRSWMSCQCTSATVGVTGEEPRTLTLPSSHAHT